MNEAPATHIRSSTAVWPTGGRKPPCISRRRAHRSISKAPPGSAATTAQMYAGFNWACEYAHVTVVEFLLDHGVSLNDARQIGVYWASYGGHVETLKALLTRNPPLDRRDASFNATPLGWAVQGWWERRDTPETREPYYEIVRLLVAAGAPVEQRWLRGSPI